MDITIIADGVPVNGQTLNTGATAQIPDPDALVLIERGVAVPSNQARQPGTVPEPANPVSRIIGWLATSVANSIQGTRPVAALRAILGTQSNVDVAIVPRGQGALSLAVPDNATTGGNKRGTNAIDLQLIRAAASQVASGSNAVALGLQNTASGNNSVALGQSNTTSGQNALAAGRSHSIGGNDSACLGGASSTASGSQAVVVGGAGHTASGNNSAVVGGVNGTTNGINGQVVTPHNSDAAGRYQHSLTGLRAATTGATLTRATADGAAGGVSNQLTLRNNSAFRFVARIVAMDTVTLDAKEWGVVGLIKRGATAASTALVGSPSITSDFADANAASWTVAVVADTTNGALGINVQGAGTNSIRWSCQVQANEVN